MRLIALPIVCLLFAMPALAADQAFPVPEPEVTYDEEAGDAEQVPEVPLDPVVRRFLMMDLDQSATVSRQEYVDGAIARATERFDKIDADHDGEATPDEYRAFRRANREWWAQRFRLETKPQTAE